MEKLATLLRQTRESRRLSLKDVEAATRIPTSYLLALEGESEGGLLSDQAYLVPFLRTYANFLGMDTNAAVMQFLSELQPTNVRSGASTERPIAAAPVSSAPLRLSFWAIPFLLFLGLLFVGSFFWQNGFTGIDSLWPTSGTKQEFSSERETTLAVAPPQVSSGAEFPTAPIPPPSESEASVPTSSLSANPPSASEIPRSDSVGAPVASQTEPTPASVASSQSVPPVGTDTHHLSIQASAPSWVRIVIDDQPPKEMILKSGESREWSAQNGFTLSFGNAGGVTLNLDGQLLPPVGKSGQVVRNIRLPADLSSSTNMTR
jgi:cytoskeleton protein RodZ